MPRARSFDAETTFDAIRDVFWANGYNCTSFEQIKAATNLNKSSLYAAFGDKIDLFLCVLRSYQSRLLGHARKQLSSDPDARLAIAAWLFSFLPVSSGNNGTRGCLAINTLMEGSAIDSRIRLEVEAYQRHLEAMLCERLEQGKVDGDFEPDFDTAAAARAIVAGYTGLMMLARQCPPAALTRAAMSNLLKIVNCPSP